jgi:hypothetical protein
MAVVPLRLCGARRGHRGDEGCAHEQCRSDYEFLRCHRNFSAFDFYEKTRGLSFAQERTKLTAPMILWAAASQFFFVAIAFLDDFVANRFLGDPFRNGGRRVRQYQR